MGTILTCKDLIFTHRHSASGMQVGPISFKLEEGESFGIVGESGSGKTSLSHLLCRFIKPHQGQLYLQGRSYEEFSTKEFYQRSSILINTHMLVFIQLDRYIRA